MSKKSKSKQSIGEQSTPNALHVPPDARPAGRWRVLIASGVALLLVIVVGTFLYAQSSSPASRPGLASLHAPTLGEPNARVHIVEFLDPACETCATFYPLVKQMLAANPGKIRLSIRHVPFHKGSGQVVALLESSRKQDKYWQTLERLLATQELWVINHVADPERARRVLAGMGLNVDRLEADMKAAEVEQRMALDRNDAAQLKVTKTPEYFVNGRQMQTFGRQQLERLVGDELKRAY